MAEKLSADATAGNGPDPNAFLDHWNAINESGRALEEAQSIHQDRMKRAKKDGVDIDTLKLLRKLQKQDPDVANLQLKTLGRYAKWTGKPLGFQAGMFEQDDSDMPTEASATGLKLKEAEQAGYTDATHKSPVGNNPHPAGSPMGVAYIKGWRAGTEFMTKSGKASDQETVVTGRKRGPRNGSGKRAGKTTGDSATIQ